MVVSLACIGAATGFRMVGDIWPKIGDQKRQGQPATIQEAFEGYEIEPGLVTRFKSMGDIDKGIRCGNFLYASFFPTWHSHPRAAIWARPHDVHCLDSFLAEGVDYK